jgi:hypothetical protein
MGHKPAGLASCAVDTEHWKDSWDKTELCKAALSFSLDRLRSLKRLLKDSPSLVPK